MADKIPSKGINLTKVDDKKALEDLVLRKFPSKVIELTDLLKQDEFRDDYNVFDELDMKSVTSDGSENSEDVSETKRLRLDQTVVVNEEDSDRTKQTMVHTNRELSRLMDLLRPVMEEFIEDAVKVNIGTTLMVPQIEDGNNFGVEVQEEVLDVIKTAQDDIYTRISEFHKFWYTRALLVKNVVKYPKVEDCRRAVHEKDQTFHRFLRMCLILVRNHYLILNDVIEKNLNKIKKPKSSSKSNMY